jgi:hypothetical protein
MKSAAGMSMFSKAKCGALHKHCLMGNCGGKRFDGQNWSKHVKVHTDKGMAVESISYVACVGEECSHC